RRAAFDDVECVIATERPCYAKSRFEIVVKLLAGFVVKAANRAVHLYIIGNDVRRDSAMNRSDGHHRRTNRVNAAGADAVNGVDHLRQNEDRIDAAMRVRAVTAFAFDGGMKR